MSKTNSNSITSILILALNNNSSFRDKMLNLFSEKIRRKIDDRIKFYDCTHNPLHYPEMNGKEIDIIARVPGIHKPKMMIEVKASIGEVLQDSQKKGQEYQKTSENHDIPLIYIIPKGYIHISNLPDKAIKIFWEDLKEITKELNQIPFDKLIEFFVEITDKSKEIQLDKNKKEILDHIKVVIDNCNDIDQNTISYQSDEWGIGYYFSAKNTKTDYFIGFTPDYLNDEKFFSLCVAENCGNVDLGDRNDNPVFFNDGWYYFPIFGREMTNKDKKTIYTKIIKDIQNILKKEDVELFKSVKQFLK